ncbi:MAG: class I SAM-dependent methyltransferase [Haloferacaceae archaeon]|jgi:SAM-dependent methyltransferase
MGGDEPTDGADGVHAVYDRIADHFAATRASPWPEVVDFLADRGPVACALDVGCGNGRHAELLAGRAGRVVGVDASGALLDIARDDATEAGYGDVFAPVRGDAGALPLASGVAGLGVYVATLHHLRPRARRRTSLDEFARVLGPEGAGLVSVWSVDHDRFDADAGFDTTVPWTLPDGERVPRFYHVYDLDGFRADLAASACRPVETFVSSGNCYAVVRGA